MATVTQTLGTRVRNVTSEAGGWLQENVWGSPGRLVFYALLIWAAMAVFAGRWEASVVEAGLVGGLWLIGLALVIVSALRHRFNRVTQWLKDRMYGTFDSAVITLIISLLIVAAVRGLVDWAYLNANFSNDPAVVRASEHTGATWGIIRANIKLFMVYQFDSQQLWRVWASVALLVIMAAISVPVYGPLSAQLKPVRRYVTWAWLITPPIFYLLLRGTGQAGLVPTIPSSTWGGLLFTLIVAVFAIVVSFPLGVLLALGRRSQIQGVPAWLTYGVVGAAAAWGLYTYTLPAWPLVSSSLEYVLILWPLWLLLAGVAFQRFFRGNVVAAFSTIYIEFVRGVPLITVLFMANIMLPLFLPSDVAIENAFRAIWGFTLFSAAYLAENVRGGLQSIPKGQYEAAEALGLNTFQQLRFIILPQALRVVIPPIVGQFIGLFKDTSLVAIVGLFDLLNIANSVVAQPDWLGLRLESYVFITAIYYVGCALMAAGGSWLEKRLGVGVR